MKIPCTRLQLAFRCKGFPFDPHLPFRSLPDDSAGQEISLDGFSVIK